nr:hypothetical protein L203_00511 [Cryptococcus depauperatus CBS 7841]
MENFRQSMGMGNGYGAYPHETFTETRARRKSVGAVLLQEPDNELGIGKEKGQSNDSFSLPFHSGRQKLRQMQRPFGRRSKIIVCLGLFLALYYGFVVWRRTYEIQVELSIFSKKWIASEIDSNQPLRGCFKSQEIDSRYNMTKHLAPRRYMLSPGISLKRGMACYDFASTIQPASEQPMEHIYYHTYWRSDLIPFGERQTATFLAFLATQPLSHSTLILWTKGVDTLKNNPYVKPFLQKWGKYIQVRHVDLSLLAQGTALSGIVRGLNTGNDIYDEKAWVDGDMVRLLVLWNYGGIWMDMDQLLTRDLHPLIEEEWVTQWDCYGKSSHFPLNGALMHFRSHSPYLCEAFHLMSTSPFPKPNSLTWGSHLYGKLHRHLIANNIRPFAVLPWCFSDPRNCRTDNRFPDPFSSDPKTFAGLPFADAKEGTRKGQDILEEKVSHIWSIHLHNQWNREFPQGGWIDRLLDGYRAQVGRVERYAELSGLISDGRIVLGEQE